MSIQKRLERRLLPLILTIVVIVLMSATGACTKPPIPAGTDEVYPASKVARNIYRNYRANPAVYQHHHHGRQISVHGKIWRIDTSTTIAVSNDWFTLMDHRVVCTGIPSEEVALLNRNQKVTVSGTIDYRGQTYVVNLRNCEVTVSE